MNLKNKLWYFWGCMDVLAVMLYFVNTIQQGRIPFISDILAFSGLSSDVASGGYSVLVFLFFILDLVLLLSLFASAWFFFKRKTYAIKFAIIQEVLRFISFRCSVTLFPLLVTVSGISNTWLNLGLFVLSECLKLYSMLYLMSNRKTERSLNDSR
ncbi:TPA: hypothetical protein OMU12_001345 [Enterobacter cloacae]|nr:hypothetical protein [Enterobacter cloacae]